MESKEQNSPGFLFFRGLLLGVSLSALITFIVTFSYFNDGGLSTRMQPSKGGNFWIDSHEATISLPKKGYSTLGIHFSGETSPEDINLIENILYLNGIKTQRDTLLRGYDAETIEIEQARIIMFFN